jgi:hypothetical protein
MKRDFDLIRSILLQVEAAPAGKIIESFSLPDGTNGSTFIEHIQLLIDEGFVEGELMPAGDSNAVIDIRRLTWKGHDFLDAARNDSNWKHAMGKVAKATGTVSLEVLKAFLDDLAKKALGLP